MAKKTKKQAFTIVELVIVIAVIAILAAILIPTYSNLVKKANEATALVDAKNAITEMLANILGGNDEPADIVVMNKKAGKVYIHGYDASKGMILTYVENPEEPGSGNTFFDQAKAIRTKLITNGYLENVEITDTTSWRHMDVLNGEGGTVEKLGFDRESMVVFADCIITDKFAKKSSGGDEPVHTHSWASEWSKDANYHWHECTADGCNVTNNSEKQGYAAHTWNDGVVTKPATETEKGEKTFTCTVCDATKTEETPVTTHVHNMTKTEAKAATCTKAGNNEYWHCSGCDKYFSDANGKTETTPEAMTIPATGHNYSYTPNADGETHKAVCANCDDTIDSEDHSFGADNTCTKCGYEKITIDLSKPIYLYKAGNYTATPITTTKMFNGTNVTYHTNISITKATMPDATYDSMDDLWCEAVKSADLSGYVCRNTGSGWNRDITFMSKKELDNIRNSTAYDENYNESENGYYRLVNGVKYYCEYWNYLEIEQAFLAPSDSLIVFNGDSVSSNNYTSNNSIKVRLIIDLNGYTWTHGAVDFYADASILDSSAGKTGKAIGGTINAGGYNNTATLNVYSGTFDGNGSNTVMTSSYKDKSTINVYGGTIQNGTIGISGSGIVNMFNGIIQNNNSSSLGKTYGAGAQVNGTFNLYGGKVQNNKSKGTNEGDCGGIYVTKDGTLNIYGGEISDNTGHSGGIYLLGTLNMYDGLINGNTFSRYGGGIKAADSAVLNISGGTISNNKPSDYENNQNGGGIYTGNSNDVTINITGGIISGNEAYNGAGMFLSCLDTDDIIKNIKVTGNTAQKAGGGIYFNYCDLAVIENTKINYNKLIASTGSECGGGGIYCGGSNVSIKGSETEIIGNKITQKDGVTIYGSENNPAISGGGIYASTRGKTIKIYAGTIKDNSVCSTRKNNISVGVGDQICSAYATLYVGQSVVISNETAENKTANYGHLIAATGCTIYTQNRGWIVTKYNNDTNKDAMIVQTKEAVNVNNTWDGN